MLHLDISTFVFAHEDATHYSIDIFYGEPERNSLLPPNVFSWRTEDPDEYSVVSGAIELALRHDFKDWDVDWLRLPVVSGREDGDTDLAMTRHSISLTKEASS